MAKEKVKKVEAKIIEKPKIYYCTKGQYTFSIPEYERDEFGEVIKNEYGKPKILFATDIDGNNQHAVFIHLSFERVPVKDPKTGKTNAMIFLGRFIINPGHERYTDIIAYIERAKKNPLAGILSEDEYKEMHNPDAFAFEKKLSIYESENTELKKYNAELKQKLENLGVNIDNIE